MAVDWLFCDALVVDGTGAPAFPADVAVCGGRIVAVGPLGRPQAGRLVECGGRVLAPGFIDMHSHADIALLARPRHEAKLHQGVTTEVFSSCGIGFAPVTPASRQALRSWYGQLFGSDEGVAWDWCSVGEYLDRLGGCIAPNARYLVAHGALRVAVMGMEARPATGDELAQMVRLLRESLGAGGIGLSTSPWYPPICHADEREFRELVRVVGEYGGFYSTHMRSYADGLFAALDEEIRRSEETGVPVQIAHLACVGQGNWGRSAEVLERLARARSRGVDVRFDSYPYLAGCTLLSAFLPKWVHANGPEGILPRLRDAETRARIVAGLRASDYDWSRGQVCGVATAANKPLEGRPFADVARERGLSPAELVCALLDEEELRVSFLIHTGNEADMRALLASPLQVVGSDGLHFEGRAHPRLYGTFPRVLGHYVREERVLSLEQAVHKMTGATAERLGLRDRGVLRPGAAADLVLFDAATINDAATYEEPDRPPVGIELVLVNGVAAVEAGRHTGALPGRVLRS